MEDSTVTEWRKRIATFLVICSIISLIVAPVLFYFNYLTKSYLISGMFGSLGGFIVAFIIYRMSTSARVPTSKPDPNRAKTLTGLSFIFLGAFGGLIVGFFGVGSFLKIYLGGSIPTGLIGDSFLVFAWIIAPIIGAFIGYLIFKRSKYSKLSLYTGYT